MRRYSLGLVGAVVGLVIAGCGVAENRGGRDSPREVISDIRSISDMSQQATLLVSDVLRPTFSDIAQSLIDMAFHLKKEAESIIPGSEYTEFVVVLNTLIKEQGNYLQGCYHRADEQIRKVLVS